ncbi:unnamed protein product [Cuscuta campestris]|uniref:Uncharacterized protein n=1 Tax=Cuscuta campestris TaxID=132261 RepID=A0A484KY10_9ASTE|nr:unnamed protein product [Cuscuta campestris]
MKLELLSRHCTPTITDDLGFTSAENSFTLKEVRSAHGKGRGIPQSCRAYARVLCSKSPQEINDFAKEAAENDGRLARGPLRDTCREIEAHQFLLLRITELIYLYDASLEVRITPIL